MKTRNKKSANGKTEDKKEEIIFPPRAVHKIRNILAPIMGYSKLIEDTTKDEEIAEAGKIISQQTKKLSDYLDELGVSMGQITEEGKTPMGYEDQVVLSRDFAREMKGIRSTKAKILVVEDDQILREFICLNLKKKGYRVSDVGSASDAINALRGEEFDVILTDIVLPGMSGMELISILRRNNPNAVVISMTGYGTVETAIEALSRGASEFIIKPLNMDQVQFSIEGLLARRRGFPHLKALPKSLRAEERYGMIGQSPPMRQIYEYIEIAASMDSSVLIQGESGTGKELVARAIHRLSRRMNKPFIAINCSALSESLLISELFGHVKGAFTGARGEKKGLFRMADGGVMFLDEIGDIPMSMQKALLRVLESGELWPIGGESPIIVDVRTIASSNKDILSLVRRGQFRKDLYYRLNVLPINLPTLSQRKQDIPRLAKYFLHSSAKKAGKTDLRFSPDSLKALSGYNWPGNVRELQNIVERSVAFSRGDVITLDHLPTEVKPSEAPFEKSAPKKETLKKNTVKDSSEREREEIIRILKAANMQRGTAAKFLGISRVTLWRKMKELNIDLNNLT